jgi:anaerobic selenocysteine-containing dehydrogenase
MTDTAREAHLVLPTTTMLEDDDLVGSYGHHWLGNVRPVVPPADGARTDYEILQTLAPRVGLAGEFEASAEEWKRRMLHPVSDRGASLEALERGAVRNPLAPELLFADRRFATPGGKVDLIHEVDPSPPRPTPSRPLLLMALATERSQASQMPSRMQQGPAPVSVHPDAARGLRKGERVRVESELGWIEARLRFDERQRRDVALMPKGGWLGRGRCANVLVPARTTDAGQGAVYYDTPVRLLPCP